MADRNAIDTDPGALQAAQEAITGMAKRGADAALLIGCAGCGQCVEDCPLQLPIPELMGLYNEYLASGSAESLADAYKSITSETGKPGNCGGCRVCEGSCKNRVKIADTVHKLSALFD